MADLPTSTRVVVIGGGIMGTCASYHLARSGVEVTVIERETVGAGSTGKAAGGFRSQFLDELNIRMALENIRRLVNFDDEFNTDIGLKQWGYLFLLKDTEVEAFRKGVELQQSLGVPSELIDPHTAREMVPGIRTHDLAAATFCPLDGTCTPEAVAYGYARAAARHGARIVPGCTATEIDVKGRQIRGVRTTDGYITAREVVLAAGVWSPRLAAPLGLDLPVRPVRRHVWLTRGTDSFPRRLPMVIDFASGFYFHREASGLALGGRAQDLEGLAPTVANRAPQLLDSEITHGWWGYYSVSPDNNAIVGAAHHIDGLYYATGFSGHGFQQGPVIGEHLAQLVMQTPPTFDLSAFDARRFTSGRMIPEGAVI